MQETRHYPVPLYIPNLLCYFRIGLAFLGLYKSRSSPVSAILIWAFSAFLDALDGIAARALNQCSNFGVLLDVIADNTLRSNTWVAAATAAKTSTVPAISVLVMNIEWLTFFATQLHSIENGGEHWKGERKQDPWFVKTYFRNNFRKFCTRQCIRTCSNTV